MTYISDTGDEQQFLDTAKKPGSPLKELLPLLELFREVWFQHTRSLDDKIIKNGLPVSILLIHF